MTNAKTSSLTGLKQRRIIGKVAFYVLGLLVAVIVCIPFYWMIITSLKGRGAIMSIPVEWIPKEPTLDAYKKLFAMPEFVGSIFNSFYVSVLCTAVRLLCAAMAAFALTKIPFKGRNAVFGIYVTALMIPSQITFIPLFIIMTNMHLTNIYRELLQNITSKDLADDAWAVLEKLHAVHIPMAIGSSSKNTPLIVEKLGIGKFFDAIVDGNQILHSKPDPEVFLLAAEKLHQKPSDCLVVEDAEAGVKAALNGGFLVAGIGPAKDCPNVNYPLLSLSQLLAIKDWQT